MPVSDDASLLQLLCSGRALGGTPRRIEHNLPPRDPNLIRFVGRGDYLFRLWDWLIDKHTAVKTLTALGGTGKTAIAYEFCQQFLEDAPNWATKLIWLSAKQRAFSAILGRYEEMTRTDFSTPVDFLEALACECGAMDHEIEAAEGDQGELLDLVYDGLRLFPSLVVVDDIDTSAVGIPASCSFNIAMICSSLNLLRFITSDSFASDSTQNRSHFRGARQLVHLLAVAMDLDIDGGSVTELGWQKDNLLEILIRLFSLKLIDALRQGMPRRYVEREEDLATLRGRLDMTRQFSRLAANPARLACRFDELSPDIAINQIMRAAIDRLRRISQSPDNQRRLAELAFSYADITSMSPQALRWDEVQLDRTNARWKDLLALARLLLGERFQTTSVGEQAGFSLLFEMNTLFEEYVGRMLRRALSGSGLTVHLQGGRLFCLEEAGDGRRTFQTKPDILVRRGNEVVQIIDTKWKRIAARIDDPKQGVSQSDVYQMMAYGQLYECGLLTLLYPHHAALRSAPGVLGRYRVGTTVQRLHMASVDIADHRRVIEQLRALSSLPL